MKKRTQKGSYSSLIRIKGARAHNLKNVSLNIPKNKFVVITGLSGSGKSSLAFDTIYAEAERRFIESLSSYARQFLGVAEKPDVDSIEGLTPAIAIDQKSVSRNPRSTVGTITEIYDYLRVLFARLGEPHCPECKKTVKKQTIDEMIARIKKLPKGSSIMIASPVVRSRKGEHKKLLEEVGKRGFLRIRLKTGDKGEWDVMRTGEASDLNLDPKKKHSIDIIIDRLIVDKSLETDRARDSLETALGMADGIAVVVSADGSFPDMTFSENFSCPDCDVSLPPLEPRLFSFNSPYGACSECSGLGYKLAVDPDLVIPNKNLTLAEGAIRPWARASHRVGRQSWYWWMIEDLSSKYGFSTDVPVKELPKNIIQLLLYGENDAKSSKLKIKNSKLKIPAEGGFEGVISNLERRWKETESDWTRSEIERYMHKEVCRMCGGSRLRPEALNVLISGKSISQISALSVRNAEKLIDTLKKSAVSKKEIAVSKPLFKEISARLRFLMDVGLEYVSLDRSSATLSGGEAQRVRLATQIGSGLSGVIYVLDEPSIGLHSKDHSRLINTLKDLRDLGNTIVVVEHDKETILNSDWLIDMGPGAGVHGGRIIFEGKISDLKKAGTSTSDYVRGIKKVEIKSGKRKIEKNQEFIAVNGASENNLKNIDVKIPLGKFVCVSGVSGSGKSTLINDILAKHLLQHFYGSRETPGRHKTISGAHNVDKAIVIDQSPIGRTPRSNPATYTGTFSFVRNMFAETREARARGYKSGRFSFNVKGGRCEECEGQGVKKIEMHFLPDVYVECEECGGTRYNKEALDVNYGDKNIADVLNMTMEEALKFFENIPQIKQRLKTIVSVGLSYMKLGQPATTLSGGEAQRVKLASELSKKSTGKTLYILDEPTTGLHFDDIKKLLGVLSALVDKGNTVLVIEHNPDVLKNADWIIDLGPEGGDKGGQVVAEGTPEDIKKDKKSYTGKWL